MEPALSRVFHHPAIKISSSSHMGSQHRYDERDQRDADRGEDSR